MRNSNNTGKSTAGFLSFLAATAIAAFTVISCQSVRPAHTVYITDSDTMELLPPSAIGEPMESHQLLTGSFNGRNEFTVEAYLVADFDKTDILMMSPTGQTLCTITWNGETLDFSSSFIPASEIKAEYIVADMQLAFYDKTEIGKVVAASGLRFEFKSHGNTQTRRIYKDGAIVWSMERSDAALTVVNHLRNYTYEIEILL